MDQLYTVVSRSRPYNIVLSNDSLANFKDSLRKIGFPATFDYSRIFFVCDTNTESIVNQIQRDKTFSPNPVSVIPAGEKSKSLDQAQRLWEHLLVNGRGKDTVMVAVGGGVVGDLTGFVAGNFLRGVPYVQVPTTLLAQVDSSIGGKVGINTPQGKNLLGLFYPPLGVISDFKVPGTLPEAELRSGIVEILKAGLLFNEKLYADCLKVSFNNWGSIVPLITEAVRIKASIVESDEFEQKDDRVLLNLGHTVGHALEAALDFKPRSNGGISHGQAVALGIVIETEFAGHLELATVIFNDFSKLGVLPTGLLNMDFNQLSAAISKDKKGTAKEIKLPFVDRIGHPAVKTVKTSELIDFVVTNKFLKI